MGSSRHTCKASSSSSSSSTTGDPSLAPSQARIHSQLQPAPHQQSVMCTTKLYELLRPDEKCAHWAGNNTAGSLGILIWSCATSLIYTNHSKHMPVSPRL
eukprot:775144-Pelagomonas_calceolata.AAC.3